MPLTHVTGGSEEHLQKICDCIKKARKVAVLTGAGISTNAGIPDFRSDNGLYALIQAAYDRAAVQGSAAASPSPSFPDQDSDAGDDVDADDQEASASQDGPSQVDQSGPSTEHRDLQEVAKNHTTPERGRPRISQDDLMVPVHSTQAASSSPLSVISASYFTTPTADAEQQQSRTRSIAGRRSRSAGPLLTRSSSPLSSPLSNPTPPRGFLSRPSSLRLSMATSSPLSTLDSRSFLSSPPSTARLARDELLFEEPEEYSSESPSGASTRSGTPDPSDDDSTSPTSTTAGETESNSDIFSKQKVSDSLARSMKGKDLFDQSILSDPRRIKVWYSFTTELRKRVVNAQPTSTHRFISQLRDEGKLLRCYSQNIDLLEEKVGLTSDLRLGTGDRARFSRKLTKPKNSKAADPDAKPEPDASTTSEAPPEGSQLEEPTASQQPACSQPDDGAAEPERPTYARGVEVVYLHGSLQFLRCIHCGALCEWDEDGRDAQTLAGKQPLCPSCTSHQAERQKRGKRMLGVGKLRPNIVLYGEENPQSSSIDSIIQHDRITGPDMLLIMGTSLRVHGAKALVRDFAVEVHRRKGIVVFVNLTKPAESVWGSIIDYWVQLDCDYWVNDLQAKMTAPPPAKPSRRRRPVPAKSDGDIQADDKAADEPDEAQTAPDDVKIPKLKRRKSNKDNISDPATSADGTSAAEAPPVVEGPYTADGQPPLLQSVDGQPESRESAREARPAKRRRTEAPLASQLREDRYCGAWLVTHIHAQLARITGMPNRIPVPPREKPRRAIKGGSMAETVHKEIKTEDDGGQPQDDQAQTDSQPGVPKPRRRPTTKRQKTDERASIPVGQEPFQLGQESREPPVPSDIPAATQTQPHAQGPDEVGGEPDASILSAVKMNPRKRKAKSFFGDVEVETKPKPRVRRASQPAGSQHTRSGTETMEEAASRAVSEPDGDQRSQSVRTQRKRSLEEMQQNPFQIVMPDIGPVGPPAWKQSGTPVSRTPIPVPKVWQSYRQFKEEVESRERVAEPGQTPAPKPTAGPESSAITPPDPAAHGSSADRHARPGVHDTSQTPGLNGEAGPCQCGRFAPHSPPEQTTRSSPHSSPPTMEPDFTPSHRMLNPLARPGDIVRHSLSSPSSAIVAQVLPDGTLSRPSSSGDMPGRYNNASLGASAQQVAPQYTTTPEHRSAWNPHSFPGGSDFVPRTAGVSTPSSDLLSAPFMSRQLHDPRASLPHWFRFTAGAPSSPLTPSAANGAFTPYHSADGRQSGTPQPQALFGALRDIEAERGQQQTYHTSRHHSVSGAVRPSHSSPYINGYDTPFRSGNSGHTNSFERLASHANAADQDKTAYSHGLDAAQGLVALLTRGSGGQP